VRGCERVGQLRSDLERLIERHRPLAQPARKRLAVEVFHHQEIGVGFATDIVEDADVRVVECRDRARFLLESASSVRIGCCAVRQHLDGDGSPQSRVVGPVDLAHAALADRRGDLVRPEARARGEGHAILRSVRVATTDGLYRVAGKGR
jgi:hypothetical protein